MAGAVRAGGGRSGGAVPRRAGGPGAALELGVGTGRIALPLSRRGVRVHGIDLSPHMVAELRAKPDSDDIGDFATTRADWNRAPFTDDSTMHVSVWEDGLAPSVAPFGDNGRGGPTREAM